MAQREIISDRQTDRQTDRHTDRQTDRQTGYTGRDQESSPMYTSVSKFCDELILFTSLYLFMFW